VSNHSPAPNDPAEVATVVARLRAFDEREVAESQRRNDGIVWSGYTPRTAPRLRSDVELQAEAEAEVARLNAFRASPRGRFVAALRELCELGFLDEEARLYGIYSRSLRDVRRPLDLKAVADAFAVLIPMNRRVSSDAMEALNAMLAEAGQALAERVAA